MSTDHSRGTEQRREHRDALNDQILREGVGVLGDLSPYRALALALHARSGNFRPHSPRRRTR